MLTLQSLSSSSYEESKRSFSSIMACQSVDEVKALLCAHLGLNATSSVFITPYNATAYGIYDGSRDTFSNWSWAMASHHPNRSSVLNCPKVIDQVTSLSMEDRVRAMIAAGIINSARITANSNITGMDSDLFTGMPDVKGNLIEDIPMLQLLLSMEYFLNTPEATIEGYAKSEYMGLFLYVCKKENARITSELRPDPREVVKRITVPALKPKETLQDYAARYSSMTHPAVNVKELSENLHDAVDEQIKSKGQSFYYLMQALEEAEALGLKGRKPF